MPYRNGVRSARPVAEQRCPQGMVLQQGRKPALPEFLQPGPCAGCGVMIHAPGRHCRCALLRRGQRVCRDCAIGFDFLSQGWTKIEGAPFMPETIALMKELLARGAHIAALPEPDVPSIL